MPAVQQILDCLNGNLPNGFNTIWPLPNNSALLLQGQDPTFTLYANTDWNGYVAKYPWARTNIFLYSQDYTQAAWTKNNNTTTLPGSITAPDGSTTGNLFTDSSDGAPTIHSIVQNLATVGIQQTISVYAKAGTLTQIYLALGSVIAYFNLSTLATTSGGVIQSVGNGWYRCSLSGAPATTSSGMGSASGMSDSYQGAGTGTLNFWGAQLEMDSLSNYIKTTTVVVSATDCTIPNFVPWRNLYSYSQAITRWTTNGTDTLSASGTAPDGSVTSLLLTLSTTNIYHYILQNYILTANTIYTESIYAKANGYNFVRIQALLLNNTYTTGDFNLATGQIVNSAGIIGATITPVGNGWYRCSITYNSNTGATPPNNSYQVADTQLHLGSGFAGNGSSGMYLWGMQLEQYPSAMPYVATTSGPSPVIPTILSQPSNWSVTFANPPLANTPAPSWSGQTLDRGN